MPLWRSSARTRRHPYFSNSSRPHGRLGNVPPAIYRTSPEGNNRWFLIVSLQSHDPWYQYMTEAIVRSAAEHDLPEEFNLYRQLHPHDPQLETATAERVWSTLLTSSFMTVIVAQAAEQLVSSCTLAIAPNLSRGGRSYGVIENVVTHADYRRLGLGRRVLAHALDVAWQADCYKVLLATGSKRETTLRFYEVAGFHRGGKTTPRLVAPPSPMGSARMTN
jgi:GNAT superfamily N-acetyltransferase